VNDVQSHSEHEAHALKKRWCRPTAMQEISRKSKQKHGTVYESRKNLKFFSPRGFTLSEIRDISKKDLRETGMM
jgi:hypothetical protein